jgi:hypothetical protein
MNFIVDLLIRRLGVLRTWGSLGRVVVWVAVWALIISFAISPQQPSHEDREHAVDNPASTVRYAGPISRQDLSGFIGPPHRDDHFTIAWIGGSEVKLQSVSIPAEFEQRVRSVGGRPIQIDAYTIVSPRVIDALAAVDAALANGADAIIVSLQPVWTTDDNSLYVWRNLDIADSGLLFGRPDAWPAAVAFTTPADLGWSLSRALFPVVEAQFDANDSAAEIVDSVDIIARPAPDAVQPQAEPGDPRLPSSTPQFWQIQRDGLAVLENTTIRVASQLSDESTSIAERFTNLLIETVSDADVPVYMYAPPFAPQALTDPIFATSAARVEAYWLAAAENVTTLKVRIDGRSMTAEFANDDMYFDVIHLADAGPFASILVERICHHLRSLDSELECG